MHTNPCTVYLVDDDPAVCRLITAMLLKHSIRVVTFSTGQAILAASKQIDRGCIILDLELPDISGDELQLAFQSKGISLPILFLSGTADVATTARVMKRGAINLIQKPFDENTIIPEVLRAIQNDADSARHQADQKKAKEIFACLTSRELEVTQQIVRGLSNKQIAYALSISERTVETHRSNVMRKTASESLANLIQIYVLATAEAGDLPGTTRLGIPTDTDSANP